MLRLLRGGELLLGGLLLLGLFFIVTNTMKLTIHSRQEEVEILKLVGATDEYVRIPFVLEAAALGLLSAGISLLILYGGYRLLAWERIPLLDLGVLEFQFLDEAHLVALVCLSVLLSVGGTLLASRRML